MYFRAEFSIIALFFVLLTSGRSEELFKEGMWDLLTGPKQRQDNQEGRPKLEGFKIGALRAGEESWPEANLRFRFGAGWMVANSGPLAGLMKSYFHPSEKLAVAVFYTAMPRGGEEVVAEFLGNKKQQFTTMRLTGKIEAEGRAKELGMVILGLETKVGIGQREVGLIARMTKGGIGYIFTVTGPDMKSARAEFYRFVGTLSWIDKDKDFSVPAVAELAIPWAGLRIPCDGEWLTPQASEFPNGVSAARISRRLDVTAFDFRGMEMSLRDLTTALLGTMEIGQSGAYDMKESSWGSLPSMRVVPKPENLLKMGMYWEIETILREGILLVSLVTIVETNPELIIVHRKLLSRAEFTAAKGEAPVMTRPEDGAYAALFYNNVGLRAFENGKFGVASKAFERSVAFNGKDPNMVINLASSLNAQGRTKAALEFIEQGATAIPNHSGILLWKAGLLAKSGKAAEAAELYDKLYQEGMRDEAELGLWIQTLQTIGNHKRAVEVAKAMHGENGSLAWQRVLANSLWHAGDLAAAREHYVQLAVELGGEQDFVADYVALLVDAKAPKEAMELIERWEKEQEAPVAMLFSKGMAQMSLGRFKDAVLTFTALDESLPGNQTVREWLSQAQAMLGQGGREGLRDDIVEIELPSELARRAEETLGSIDAKKDYSGEGWVLLEDIRIWNWSKGEDARNTHRQRIRILDASGVSAYSTLYVPFQPNSERVTIHRMSVVSGDGGAPTHFRKEEIHVRDSGGQLADGSKVVCIPVPALKEGAVIELVYTKSLLGTADSYPMVTEIMPEGYAMVYGAIVFTGDLKPLRFLSNEGLELVTNDSWRAYVATHVRRSKGQSHLPRYLQWGRICWAGEADRTWKNEAKEYLKEIQGFMDDETFASQVVTELKLDGMPPQEAIRTVVRWMNLKFQYQGIEFGRRARIPAKGADTLSRGFGDCKDFSILLRAILRKAGVKAELALTHSGGLVRKEIASLDQFDHMVIYLPDQGGLVLDGTISNFNTPEALHSSALGVPLFRLEAEEPGFVIPKESKDGGERTTRIERDMEIDGSTGDLKVKEIVTIQPALAAGMRYLLSATPGAEHLKTMDQMMRNKVQRIQINEFVAHDVDDPFKPLRLELNYMVKSAFQKEESRLIGTIPIVMERLMMEVDQEHDRTLGMEIRMKESCDTINRIRIPEGMSWIKPEKTHEEIDSSEFFHAICDWTERDGFTQLKATLALRSHHGTAAEFTKFHEATENAFNLITRRVRFNLPTSK